MEQGLCLWTFLKMNRFVSAYMNLHQSHWTNSMFEPTYKIHFLMLLNPEQNLDDEPRPINDFLDGIWDEK